MLGALPAREAANEQIDKASYYIALEGVTRYGLTEAVRNILKGGLSHAFFPSPPELRMQCDKAMEWPERQRERQIREDRYIQERRDNNAFVQRSPEAITRQQQAYRQFLAGYGDAKVQVEEAERADVRARYGMTDEALEAIKDRPLPETFKKLGKA